jgi:colanic acid/amylovoran biosynthesis protein
VKILITNIVTLNAGDAAILYAMIDLLRGVFGENIRIIVYDKHGETPRRYYPELEFRKLIYLNGNTNSLRFRLGRWALKKNIPVIPLVLNSAARRDLLEYKTADLIVSSGGTYLVENYSMDARIFDYELSLQLGKPLVFFTQSLGPFVKEENRRALLPIFNNALAILVRDQRSMNNLVDLGVRNANVHLAADAAFALSDPAALGSAKFKTQTPGQPLRVAVSVREWKHFDSIDAAEGMKRYRDALAALTEHLVEKYIAQVTFISTCQGMEVYWTNDARVAHTVVDVLPSKIRDSVSVNSEFHQPAVLANMLRDYDLVIATRMHMAILALGVGTPVLPIAYEFKMHELFEKLGQRRWVQDIESISAQTLVDTADAFLAALPDIREPLFNAVRKEYESAKASGQFVKTAFELFISGAYPDESRANFRR